MTRRLAALPALPPAGHGPPRLRRFDALVICAAAAYTFLLVSRAIVFGSDEGRWIYPYIQSVTASAVALAVVSAVVIPAAFELTARWATARAVLTVAAWMLIGFVFQVAARDLYRFHRPDRKAAGARRSINHYTLPASRLIRLRVVAPSCPQRAPTCRER